MEKFLNKITLGDCYELIKELPDKSVDLIVTDPPYEIHSLQGGGDAEREKHKVGNARDRRTQS